MNGLPTPKPAVSKDLYDRMPMSGSGRVSMQDRAKAQRNLAAFALEQDDPAAWLADMLGALGLQERLT